MTLLLPLKLLLVGLSALLSSVVARRFGHRAGGLLAGLPLIGGTITGFLLLQLPAADVQRVALATVVALPATVAHLVTFAWSATRWRWPVAVLAANGVFFTLGAVLVELRWPEAAAIGLAAAALGFGGTLLPRREAAGGAVAIPALELALRVAVAIAIAAAILGSAGLVPAAFSGLLLAVPITGNVLPCFTLPRYGLGATLQLQRGFIRGLAGFGAFFVVLVLALGRWPAGLAYAAAWAVALATGLLLRRL